MKVKTLIHWLPVILWAVFIFITSANPNPYKPLPASWSKQIVTFQATTGPNKVGFDELLGRFLHATEYLVLAALVAQALVGHSDLRLVMLVMAFGISAFYALSDEIHQLFVPGRAFELSDMALDLGGAILGLAVYVLLHTLWRRRERSK